MKLNELHQWDLDPQAAIALQKELAERLIADSPLDLSQIRTVAGVDVSVKNELSQAAVVVMTYPDCRVIETVRTQLPTTYPYIPGLLTFREGAVLVEAFKQVQTDVDVFVFDGMGQIHPRRIGIAAHLGLWLDKPTIGCGKTHFIGTYDEPHPEKGAFSKLYYQGQVLGAVLRTRAKTKPVYISVGHRADLSSAIDLIMSLSPHYRLPVPIRLAHQAAGQYADNLD